MYHLPFSTLLVCPLNFFSSCFVLVLFCLCSFLSLFCFVLVLFCLCSVLCSVLSLFCSVFVLFCLCSVLSLLCFFLFCFVFALFFALFCLCSVLSLFCCPCFGLPCSFLSWVYFVLLLCCGSGLFLFCFILVLFCTFFLLCSCSVLPFYFILQSYPRALLPLLLFLFE